MWRGGSGWFFVGLDLDRGDERTFRADRIIADVIVTGPAADVALPDGGPVDVSRVKVRLRVQDSDLWALENFSPSYARVAADGSVDVTIELYPPAGDRLARLLFLLRPGAVLESGSAHLGGRYRSQLHLLGRLYGVADGNHPQADVHP